MSRRSFRRTAKTADQDAARLAAPAWRPYGPSETAGTHRVYVTRIGPFGFAMLTLAFAILAAAFLLIVAGAILLWLPVVALLIVVGAIVRFLR